MCSPVFTFGSLMEGTIMDASAWVQFVLHQQVSVWHFTSMHVSPHIKKTVCVHMHMVMHMVMCMWAVIFKQCLC